MLRVQEAKNRDADQRGGPAAGKVSAQARSEGKHLLCFATCSQRAWYGFCCEVVDIDEVDADEEVF